MFHRNSIDFHGFSPHVPRISTSPGPVGAAHRGAAHCGGTLCAATAAKGSTDVAGLHGTWDWWNDFSGMNWAGWIWNDFNQLRMNMEYEYGMGWFLWDFNQLDITSLIWLWINTYENTIFRGMNIHESQLFWCELQGYKVLTNSHITGLVVWNIFIHNIYFSHINWESWDEWGWMIRY